MNFSFLVDVNLPKYFSFFNEDHFAFVFDLDLQMSDTEIWNYALKNQLIILTKDTDFYNRFLVSATAPKIIYFQLGNCSLKQLHQYFNDNWDKIHAEIENSKLIIAKENHIEIIH
jgi:predicted nuclease of predicted toxin-antitoxin system